MEKRTIILIPAFNQTNELNRLFNLAGINLNDILLIDDGSTDSTQSIASNHKIRTIKHEKRLGYGAALLSGLKFAMENSYDRAVTVDADGAHHFEEIPNMIWSHIQNKADLSIGSRFLKRENFEGFFPDSKANANTFATYLFNRAFGLTLTDVASGFRVIEKTLFHINIESTNMGFTYELLLKAAKNKFKICESAISVRYNAENLFSTNQSELLAFLKIIFQNLKNNHDLKNILQDIISKIESYSKVGVKIGSDFYVLYPLRSQAAYVFQRQNPFYVDNTAYICF